MSKIAIKTIIALLLVSVAMPMDAAAQVFKRKKPTVKQMLVSEQRRADSLEALVVKYQQQGDDVEAEETSVIEVADVPCEVKKVLPPREYTPAVADSLAAELKMRQVDEMFDRFFAEYICEPVEVSGDAKLDSLYESRLKLLVSPIHLPYNTIVRSYIQRYTQPTGVMQSVLSLAQYYFPMIDEELIKAGLPVELHAMAIIESALRSTAVSRAGAAGLWQFMPTTGRSYGLQINSMVDERFDPVKSTKAACRFMKDLYNMYNDWSLAIAAYNCGPGNVNKAIYRSGGKTAFWDIYWNLPRETRGYLPAFIAATYIMTYHAEHGICPMDSKLPLATDTIMVNRLLHFDQIVAVCDIDIETLRGLNPQYREDIIPGKFQPNSLRLPEDKIRDFILSGDSIYNYEREKYFSEEKVKVLKNQATNSGYVVHKIRSGESLSTIARRYRVTVTDLKRWNNLRSNNIVAGKTLKVYPR